MKVLHIVENFVGAGLENVVKDLVIGSISNEIQPYICVLNQHGHCGTVVKKKGIQVFDLKRKQLNKNDFQIIKELKKLIEDLNIDIIHAHNFTSLYYGILSAFFKKIRILVTFHGFTDWSIKKRIFYSIVFKRFKIIVVNDAMKKHYSFLNNFFTENINTVFNGININQFNRNTDTQLREQLGINQNDFVIGSVGRLSPVKNQIMQLKTIAKLKKDKKNLKLLLITGNSPDSIDLKEKLFQEAVKLDVKDNLILLDFRKDVPALLSIMDVFIMTSLTEGTSLALLEAMASGLPVVVSDVGGNSRIVNNGVNGFLYNLSDEDTLINIIMNLFNDENLRKCIGDEAKQTASGYSTASMVDSYLLTYND